MMVRCPTEIATHFNKYFANIGPHNSSDAIFPIIPFEQAILPMKMSYDVIILTVDHRQDNTDRILSTASYRISVDSETVHRVDS